MRVKDEPSCRNREFTSSHQPPSNLLHQPLTTSEPLTSLSSTTSSLHPLLLSSSSTPNPALKAAVRNCSPPACKPLSETLVDFYPLAGRVRSSACINRNGEGAYWIEARADVRLNDFLTQTEVPLLTQFLPNYHAETLHWVASGCMLMDGFSIACFLRSWSARSAQRLEGLTPPRFIGDSPMPARELPLTLSDYAPTDHCATRRFVFHDSKISGLKPKAARSVEPTRFTRVELMLALILRCAFKASRSITGSFRLSLLQYMVNLRNRMLPALQEIDIGINIAFKGSETILQELVSNMRKEMISFRDREACGFKGGEGFSKVCESIARLGNMMGKWKEEADLYRCSSLCGFPFYKADFGSGKPVWATCLRNMKNYIYLMNTKMRDGIEAWVTLGEREMRSSNVTRNSSPLLY